MRLPSASKNTSLIILFAVLAIAGLYVWSDSVARTAWRFRLGNVALAFVRHDAELAMAIGGHYFNVDGQGDYNLALAAQGFRKALAIASDIPAAHYQLGRIYFITGKLDAAKAEIQKELTLHPEIPNSYYVRGLIEGYGGEWAVAENDFRTFVSKVPGQWAGYNDLAWILAKEGKFAEVKQTIATAFQRMPGIDERNPWLWISLGVAHLNLGEYNEAKVAFAAALKMADAMSAEYFWSAYPGNNPRGAEAAFRQFKAALYFNLGIAYEKLGEWSLARSEYQNYLALLPAGASSPERDEAEKKIIELNGRAK